MPLRKTTRNKSRNSTPHNWKNPSLGNIALRLYERDYIPVLGVRDVRNREPQPGDLVRISHIKVRQKKGPPLTREYGLGQLVEVSPTNPEEKLVWVPHLHKAFEHGANAAPSKHYKRKPAPPEHCFEHLGEDYILTLVRVDL